MKCIAITLALSLSAFASGEIYPGSIFDTSLFSRGGGDMAFLSNGHKNLVAINEESNIDRPSLNMELNIGGVLNNTVRGIRVGSQFLIPYTNFMISNSRITPLESFANRVRHVDKYYFSLPGFSHYKALTGEDTTSEITLSYYQSSPTRDTSDLAPWYKTHREYSSWHLTRRNTLAYRPGDTIIPHAWSLFSLGLVIGRQDESPVSFASSNASVYTSFDFVYSLYQGHNAVAFRWGQGAYSGFSQESAIVGWGYKLMLGVGQGGTMAGFDGSVAQLFGYSEWGSSRVGMGYRVGASIYTLEDNKLRQICFSASLYIAIEPTFLKVLNPEAAHFSNYANLSY